VHATFLTHDTDFSVPVVWTPTYHFPHTISCVCFLDYTIDFVILCYSYVIVVRDCLSPPNCQLDGHSLRLSSIVCSVYSALLPICRGHLFHTSAFINNLNTCHVLVIPGPDYIALEQLQVIFSLKWLERLAMQHFTLEQAIKIQTGVVV